MTDAWSVVSSIATAIAAIAAMAAAGASFWQIVMVRQQADNDRREKAVLRAFEYSPYSQPQVLEARIRLHHKFSGLKDGEPASLEQINSAFLDKSVLADFNLLLNHWGRFATARRHDLVDRRVAKDLLRFGFLRFWGRYQAYLQHQFAKDPSLSAQYADVQALYQAWKE